MNIQNVLNDKNISIQEKHNVVKNHTLNILKSIVDCIEKEEYSSIMDYLAYSPAGDGYGNDNYFINFNLFERNPDGTDIREITSILSNLKEQKEK